MENNEKYFKAWDSDSKVLASNGTYDWMLNHIRNYNTILEIGCGSGISTLKLLQDGHNVVVIESNDFCINAAKDLLARNGYEDVVFIKWQISELNCRELIERINSNIDLLICWNPGGAAALSSTEMQNKFSELLGLEYEINSIESFESAYAEDIIRSAFIIGDILNKDLHIIDRFYNEDIENMKYIKEHEYGYSDWLFDQITGPTNENTMRDLSNQIYYKSFLFTR